jgi:hypothetical protein
MGEDPTRIEKWTLGHVLLCNDFFQISQHMVRGNYSCTLGSRWMCQCVLCTVLWSMIESTCIEAMYKCCEINELLLGGVCKWSWCRYIRQQTSHDRVHMH